MYVCWMFVAVVADHELYIYTSKFHSYFLSVSLSIVFFLSHSIDSITIYISQKLYGWYDKTCVRFSMKWTYVYIVQCTLYILNETVATTFIVRTKKTFVIYISFHLIPFQSIEFGANNNSSEHYKIDAILISLSKGRYIDNLICRWKAKMVMQAKSLRP